MIEPTSRLSTQLSAKTTCAAAAVMAAVMPTPTVDSVSAGQAAARSAF
jgi:hypothetical protein